jgi:peptidoglycan/LPS O-acetylase OafA/YrhL
LIDPLNPLFALTIYIIALSTAFVINRCYQVTHDDNRYETIDGFRGLLALGVFIHHAVIWHASIHTGRWASPKSIFYSHLGDGSVSFFFMITAFLFITKLLQQEENFNWTKFFLSRIFRLVPMYIVTLLVMVSIIYYCTNGTLNVPLIALVKQLIHWSMFTVTGSPDINNFDQTRKITSSVVWTFAS